MFLHLSVILFTGESLSWGSLVCLCHGDPPFDLRAGGTHPTGIHSCFVNISSKEVNYDNYLSWTNFKIQDKKLECFGY